MSGSLLVFGAAGQVGRALMALAHERDARPVGLTRSDVDITDPVAVDRAIAAAAPRLVVNCAAYTAVDRAESEPAVAAAVNGNGAGVLARAADHVGVPILHISTDYVFDGNKAGPYNEDDPIAPLGVYGSTKARGEALVRVVPRHVILRTSWVYGLHGGNFLKTMLRLASERDSLRVVADQWGCPTAARDIAEAILAVDARIGGAAPLFGTYHFAGTGVTTWHGFAEAIVAAQRGRTGKVPPVHAIATADYPTPARRPANSELDSSLFAHTFGLRAAAWPDRVREVVDTLLDDLHPPRRTAS